MVISLQHYYIYSTIAHSGPGSSVGIATELRAGRSGDRIPMGARFSAPVQAGPGAHPASCTIVTGSFPGVKSGRGVLLTTYPLLVPWSRKSRTIPLLPPWAVRPVQGLSACTRVHFYNRTQAEAPVCQQRTAVLPVPDRETVGKTFVTWQEQKQLANRAYGNYSYR